jgi:hypothetical protein
MSTELNDKILDIIRDVHCDTDNWGHCGGANRESQKEAANAIEALVLESKIDLLNMLHKPEYTTFITKQAVFIDGGISEEPETSDGYELIHQFENQLKKLKAD